MIFWLKSGWQLQKGDKVTYSCVIFSSQVILSAFCHFTLPKGQSVLDPTMHCTFLITWSKSQRMSSMSSNFWPTNCFYTLSWQIWFFPCDIHTVLASVRKSLFRSGKTSGMIVKFHPCSCVLQWTDCSSQVNPSKRHSAAAARKVSKNPSFTPVSYTHLTLPTTAEV